MEINNIYLGNAYELIKELPDKSIDLIYTDVPYLYVQGGGGSSDLGKRSAKKRIELMGVNDDKQIQDLVNDKDKRTSALTLAKSKAANSSETIDMEEGFNFAILDEFVRVMKHIYIYIWCSKLQILPLMKYFVEEKKCNFDILTWHKTNPMPTHNNCYPPDTEYCLLFREKGTGMGGNMSTLKKYYVSSLNKADKDSYLHPTIKPLTFVENMIFNSMGKDSNKVVLDPFAGSATTCVAAKRLGLNYIGFELNKKYYKIAKERLEGFDQNGQGNLFDM